MISYAYFADQLLMAVYEKCGLTPQNPCQLREILVERGLTDHADWLATITDDFAKKGYWGVEIADGPMVHLTAAGIREAERLIAAEAQGDGIGPSSHLMPAPDTAAWRRWTQNIDWGKWGAIAAIVAIPVAIFCAWYFQ